MPSIKMKRDLVLKFSQYIKEAYISPEGELGDFDLSNEEELEMELQEHLRTIKGYLKNEGARNVKTAVEQGIARFVFEFRGEYYTMDIDMDTNRAMLVSGRTGRDSRQFEMYSGDVMELFDQLAERGLNGLLGYL